MSAVNFIISLARKILARESKGITTIPNKMAVEQKAGEIAARLQDAGLPLNRADEFIRSEQDLVRILNLIESTPPVTREVPSGIRNTKTAKIMDMQGKEIPQGSKIMGGKAADEQDSLIGSLDEFHEDFVKETGINIPKENLKQAYDVKKSYPFNTPIVDKNGKFIGQEATQKQYPESKKFKVQEPDELDAEIKARLEKGNKEGIARIKESQARERQKMIENSIDNQSPGFSGDRKVDAVLVAEEMAERMGKVYDDLPIKEQTKLYGEAFDALSKKRFDPPDDMAQGGRAGFFMGSPNPKGLGLLRALLNFFGKKSDVVKNPSDLLKKTNPKKFNKILEDAKGKVIPKEGIMATDRIKGYQTEMAKDRVEAIRDLLETGKRIKADDDKILTYKNQVKNNFMKDLKMSEADAEKAADRMVRFARDVTRAQKTPEITEEGILQLENVLKNMETGGKKKRDLNADGGRIGFKDGMTRRTFLKILGGAMAIPIVGKFLKPFKTSKGVTKVPIIKTDNVPGKPEWFDQLVNKVIIEGDDVTKKLATGERQTVHQKTLDDGTVVRVTEDIDNGAVRVEYQSEKNVFGDDVLMQYKKPLPDQEVPNPRAQFITSESGPVGRRYGPDDYEIDVDEVVGTSIRDLDSDVSKLKQYATGKGPTMKEILQNKKRQDRAKAISEDMEAQSDAVIRRQGEADDSYYGDPEELASGGIARMLGE